MVSMRHENVINWSHCNHENEIICLKNGEWGGGSSEPPYPPLDLPLVVILKEVARGLLPNPKCLRQEIATIP